MAALIIGAIGAIAGVASSIMGSNAKKRAARRAAAEAKRIREWYEGRARETKAALGQELRTMRTLRDLDMPSYQEAAEIASVQRAKGYERQARAQQLGRLPQAYRDAVFGGQLQQYIGREGQKIERYAKMSQGIFGMATQMQTQVNDLLKAGGASYASMMGASQAMEYEAGSPIGQALGALGQGMSLASQGMTAKANQQALMAKEAGIVGKNADPTGWGSEGAIPGYGGAGGLDEWFRKQHTIDWGAPKTAGEQPNYWDYQ